MRVSPDGYAGVSRRVLPDSVAAGQLAESAPTTRSTKGLRSETQAFFFDQSHPNG